MHVNVTKSEVYFYKTYTFHHSDAKTVAHTVTEDPLYGHRLRIEAVAALLTCCSPRTVGTVFRDRDPIPKHPLTPTT